MTIGSPRAAVILALSLATASAVPAAAAAAAAADESVCYGTPSNGRLEQGRQLAESGPNFEPYSVSLHATSGFFTRERIFALMKSSSVRLAFSSTRRSANAW